MSQKIGFVGLGAIGFPMAVNLVKAGYDVVGYDAFKGVYEKAEAEGLTMVETVKEVADQSDEAVISMVRNYEQNVDVIFGENGLVAGDSKGKTVICMSTLDPDTMKQLNDKVDAESDLNLIDAGVSGGVEGAKDATLSIMVSGPEHVVKACQPYFDVLGSNTFYYGSETGNSQIAKLINNLILGVNVNAVAEGLKLAEHYGLPQDELLNLLEVSTGDSWVVRNWDNVSQWTADATLNVLLTDLNAVHQQGIQQHVPLPFSALATTQLMDAMGERKLTSKSK
ncbi:3-hydroxyisobutyrate dehydrogenase [Alkalibacillus flavidus]|uniref:3-hydroxyisobutyrate dehydrogenase n=1 Tax=Alkalibacillus flavidus TaxID=546021 RepID=A0ABV2KXW7_9BACI